MKKIMILLFLIIASTLYAPDAWRWVQTDVTGQAFGSDEFYNNLTNECKLEVFTNNGSKISCDQTGTTDYAGIQGAISVCFKNGSVVFQQFGPFIVHEYCKQLLIPGEPLKKSVPWFGEHGIYLGNKNPLGKF